MLWIEEVSKQVDLTRKCGSCKWLDYSDKSSIGYKCVGRKNFNSVNPCACRKPRTTKACKYYEWDGKTTKVLSASHYKAKG